MRYKFCKFCENRIRDTPLRGVYIPHFGQISVKISVLRVLYPYRCTDGGEIWHGGGDHHRCNDKGIGPLKLKFLLIFGQNVEYKRPVGAYPLCDFHKICKICTSFQDALAVKVSLNFLKGLLSYGRFNLTGSDNPQIFSAP